MMSGGRSIPRPPFTCRWLLCLLTWSLFELCHCQDSDAATDTPDTPNLLSCDIEVNDIIPPSYSNLVADGIISEEENAENRGQGNSTVVRMDPVTPPPNYDVVFKPSWPRSASAYVLHPERIEEVAMADLYTRQTSRTSERTVRSENSINRSVSFADTTPEGIEDSSQNIDDAAMQISPDVSGGTYAATSDGSMSRTDELSQDDIVQSPRSISESEPSARQQSEPSQVQSPVTPETESTEERTSSVNANEEENNNRT
ncbi:uncharacterized protein LOC144438238 isoform X2 [Glandiceps talaboti]